MNKLFVLVRPEGGTCVDCSCDKPTRTIEARPNSHEFYHEGDQVILESSPALAGLGAALLLFLFVGGAVAGWLLAGPAGGETLQAAAAIGGGFAGLLIATIIAAPLRKGQIPVAKKITLTLHTQDQSS